MSEHIKTSELARVKDKKVFFDANIWMYLFCEIGNYNDNLMKKYSSTLHYFLKNKISIYIDLAVISEFVNRYLRIAYSNYVKSNEFDNSFKYKKDYRKTDDFKEAWKNVCNIVNNRILSMAVAVNFEYDKNTLAGLLNSDKSDTDFNDNHIVNLCRTNDMWLLTNDGDFKYSDINVITDNRYYWQH